MVVLALIREVPGGRWDVFSHEERDCGDTAKVTEVFYYRDHELFPMEGLEKSSKYQNPREPIMRQGTVVHTFSLWQSFRVGNVECYGLPLLSSL